MSATDDSNSELKLIILDQNAISNLALQPNKEWSEILELLRYGVSRERIICPTAPETIAENLHLPGADRKLIEELSEELSRGYYTKLFYDQRGRKFEYNDETDKYRAATAFHIANGFITDRGMTAMLRQLKIEEPEIFSVFSVSETQRIITFLKTVC